MTTEVFETFNIDTFVIMPDHIHIILEITRDSKKTTRDFLRWFKSLTSRGVDVGIHPALWQRGAYDVIIREDKALANIREYITHNPARWSERATKAG
jgi:putative transposase